VNAAITERDEGDISLVTGTRLSREKGALIVDFPSQATDKAIHAKISRTVTDIRKDDRRKEPVFNRFVLQAFDKLDSKKEINQFKKSVQITVKYDTRSMAIRNERSLTLVYWDGAKKRWVSLPSSVDLKLKTVTGYTNHFTDFGLVEAPDVATFLPNLKGFQTDLFTGAANAAYELQTPPGRGGLAPQLRLDYSSGGVDMMDNYQQASFVGVGWRLGLNYIARDPRGTYDTIDDVYSLVLNGAGNDLALDANDPTNKRYHTTNEQYAYITYDSANDKWLVVATDGTKYNFGASAASRAVWQRKDNLGNSKAETYTWWLESITDTHGNTINFTYQHVPETVGNCLSPAPDRYVYPQQISYNNNLTTIGFTYSSRNDYVTNTPTNNCGPTPYQTQKLDRVDISTTVSNAMQLVRQYRFAYDYSTFSGITNDNGTTGRLTLNNVTQYGTDANSATPSSLPPYNFTYQNNRLSTATNGIGGATTFAYDSIAAGATDAKMTESYDIEWTPELYTCPGEFLGWTGNGANTEGTESMHLCFMNIYRTNDPGYIYRNVGKFVPDAIYNFSVNVGGGSGSIKLTAYDGVTEYLVRDWFTLGYNGATVGGNFQTSVKSGTLELRIYVQNGVPVHSFSFTLLNTRHRVTTKTVSDGNGTIETYNYSYTSPAVNDAAHSLMAQSFNPLHGVGWEFRGHEAVTITDAAGNKTENHFRQDDFFAGRAITITQMNSSNSIFARVVNSYASTCIPVLEWTSPFPAAQSRNSCTGTFNTTPTPIPTPVPTATPVPPPTPDNPPDPGHEPPGGGGFLLPGDGTPKAKFASLTWTGSENESTQPLSSIAPPLSPPSVPLDTIGIGTGQKAYFVYLSSTEKQTWDGQGSYKSQTTAYNYSFINDANSVPIPVSLEMKEYSDAGSALYRSTVQTFKLNTSSSVWILNKANVVQVKDAGGNRVSETHYYYDGTTDYNNLPSLGELKRVDVTSNGTNYFRNALNTYDAAGNILSTTDALNHTTNISYDPTYNLFPVFVTNALGQTTTNTYDYRLGKLASTIDPNGAKTSYAYDLFGRTTDIWNPNEQAASATAHYDYALANPRSQIHVKVRNDLGGANAATYQEAWWFYDGLGRVIQKQTQAQSSGQIVLANTGYNNLGQLLRTSNPYTVTASGGTYQAPNWSQPFTKHEYDPIGREIKTISPDPTISQTLAHNQWTTTLTDANGHQYVNAADAFGRTSIVLEKNQGQTYSTVYTYDTLNHLKTVTDAQGNSTSMNYDWRGRKTSMIDPDMGNWSYGYDNVGNLTSQTDAKNQTINFTYDALNRLTGKTYPPSSGMTNVTYTFDQGTNGIGRRTSMSDGSGSASWVYDLQGRVTSQTNSINGAPSAAYTTQFTYDAMSRARTMVYPDGENVALAYNNQGLLQTLGSYVTGSSYNAAGQLTSLTLGSGAITNYTYNPQNLRLTNLTTSNNLQNLSYQYDNVGNIQQIVDNVRGETSQFTYDDLNRLKTASIANVYSQSWNYDPLGNITSRTSSAENNGNPILYTYDSTHKHAALTMGSNSYAYDANGNMTTRVLDLLQYDAENRLTQDVSGGINTTNYIYDGDGKRVQKAVSTAGLLTTNTFYVGNYFEVTVTAVPPITTTTTKYYYFGAQRVAMKQDSTVTYLHSDHLGSTSVTSGATTSMQVYYPFGGVRASTGTLPTDYTFTGQKVDASDGLMYYGARYYDAALGRFIQADTIVPSAGNPQSLNRYAYVLNNPLRFTDPSGHDPIESDYNGKDFIDHAWRAREKAYDQTGVIILGEATMPEINAIAEVARVIKNTAKVVIINNTDSPVCADNDCAKGVIEGSTFTNVPANQATGRVGQVTINRRSIKYCAGGGKGCGDPESYTGGDYNKEFLWTVAHEFAHSAAILHPEISDAYRKIWEGSASGRLNYLEPTKYAIVYGPAEAMAEFVALSVVDPEATQTYKAYDNVFCGCRWGMPWDDPGKPRRDFIHKFFPDIQNVPR